MVLSIMEVRLMAVVSMAGEVYDRDSRNVCYVGGSPMGVGGEAL